MPSNCAQLLFLHIFYAVFIHNSLQCPKIMPEMAKAQYKSGEIGDMAGAPVTIDKIKKKIEDLNIFNFSNALTDTEKKELGKLFDAVEIMMEDLNIFNYSNALTDTEKKELGKLFDTVEIMTSSRYRQPTGAQGNMFSALRMVERAVKKQLKEGQISETLAAKFNWDGIGARQRRQDPVAKYYYDKKKKMRVFIVNAPDNDSPK